MKATTAGIDLKLWRADDHLEACFLQRMTVAAHLMDAGEDAVVGQFDADSGDYVFRVQAQLPDPEIGIILGEFAHNLRSALDHLVYQLILLAGGDPEIGKPAFPILEKAPDSKQEFPLTDRIHADHLAIIKAAQPYHYRRHPNLLKDLSHREKDRVLFAAWHPLALLGHLNNVDKHRYLHAGVTAATWRVIEPETKQQVTFTLGRPIGLWFPPGKIPARGHTVPVWSDGSLVKCRGYSFEGSEDDPAEVVRVRKPTMLVGGKMQMKPHLLLDVAFGDRKRKLAYWDLLLIRDAVREVIGETVSKTDLPLPRTRKVPISG